MFSKIDANHEIQTLSVYAAAATKLGDSLRHRLAITSSSAGRIFFRYNSVALYTISAANTSFTAVVFGASDGPSRKYRKRSLPTRSVADEYSFARRALTADSISSSRIRA